MTIIKNGKIYPEIESQFFFKKKIKLIKKKWNWSESEYHIFCLWWQKKEKKISKSKIRKTENETEKLWEDTLKFVLYKKLCHLLRFVKLINSK